MVSLLLVMDILLIVNTKTQLFYLKKTNLKAERYAIGEYEHNLLLCTLASPSSFFTAFGKSAFMCV